MMGPGRKAEKRHPVRDEAMSLIGLRAPKVDEVE
jgi:hypothetical protein